MGTHMESFVGEPRAEELKQIQGAAGEVSVQLYQGVPKKNALPASLGKFIP